MGGGQWTENSGHLDSGWVVNSGHCWGGPYFEANNKKLKYANRIDKLVMLLRSEYSEEKNAN